MTNSQKDDIIRSLKKIRDLVVASDLEIDQEKLIMGDHSAVKMRDELKMQQAYLALFDLFTKLDD